MCVCVFVDSYTVYKKWFLVSTEKNKQTPIQLSSAHYNNTFSFPEHVWLTKVTIN